MNVLQIVPDRFSNVSDAIALDASTPGAFRSSTATNHVRRMTRGIVIKEDSFATLRVVTGGNNPVKIIDAGSRRGPDPDDGAEFMHVGDKRATDIYSNFLILQAQESRMEKQQIVETFGEPYIFLFGERARIINISGVLANTQDFNWEAEWWHNYDHYLRGTKCVENDARVFLSFDTTLVGGYIIGSAATKTSQEPNYVQFEFQLFVTSYTNFSDIGNPSAGPVEDGAQVTNFSLTEDQALAFRPTIVSEVGAGNPLPGFNPSDNDPYAKYNLIDRGALHLADGISSFVGNIAKGVDTMLSTTSLLMSGEVVRVPIGYQGTLAYDEESDIMIKDVKFGGKVTYTTFDKNSDEYVGRGTQYASSAIGVVSPLLGAPNADNILGSKADLEKIEEAWNERGLSTPPTMIGPVTALLLRGVLGLAGVGASRIWSKFALTSPGAMQELGTNLNIAKFGTSDVSQIQGIHFPE